MEQVNNMEQALMQDKVLIVEDDHDIARLIGVNLDELGIQVEYVDNGEVALNQALAKDYSLIMLDIMLPDLNGLDICRTLRDKKPDQAIIMLTSRNSETDRVVGLEIGADDYMTKPFSVRELQARVRAQLRKVHLMSELKLDTLAAEQQNETGLRLGRLLINQQTHEVTLDERLLDLTSTEYDLLLYLANNPNQVFSRAQLLDSVWGYQHSGYEHTVNSHINRLRNKIEHDVNNPTIVQTVWGVGYKFNPKGVH